MAALRGSLSELAMFGCRSREFAANGATSRYATARAGRCRRSVQRRVRRAAVPALLVTFSRRCLTEPECPRSAIAPAIAYDCIQEDLSCGRHRATFPNAGAAQHRVVDEFPDRNGRENSIEFQTSAWPASATVAAAKLRACIRRSGVGNDEYRIRTGRIVLPTYLMKQPGQL